MAPRQPDPEVFGGTFGPSGGVIVCDADWNPQPVEYARHRLRWIIRRDREACGDGRWELSGINLSGFYLESCLMKKEHVSFQNKPRCRWVQRA